MEKIWQCVLASLSLFSGTLLFLTPIYATTSDVTPTETNELSTSWSPHLEPRVVYGKDHEVYSEKIDNTIEYIYLYTFKDLKRVGDLKVHETII